MSADKKKNAGLVPMSNKTTPPLRGTPPVEGNVTTPRLRRTPPKEGNNSPSPKGWQAKPDGVVPKLRFPEFRDAGEWEQRELSHYIESLDAGVSVNSGDRPARGDEIGILKTSCVSNGDFDSAENKVVQDADEISRVKEPVLKNTIVISRMNTTALVGANAYVENDMPNLFLPDRLWAAKSTGAGIMRFLAYILGSEQGRSTLSGLASGSSGTMKNIGKSEVLALRFAAPSLKEQQKIADCLASLDDLIRLEAEKLAAIKTHKKGLMQQLFPAEGETLPKLRFPEFRDAGEWNEALLREVGSVRMCKRIFKEQTNSIGEIPFYKIGTFGGAPDTYIPREIFDAYRSNYPFPRIGAILISAAGTIGRVIRYEGELAYFQDSNIVWLDNDGRLITDNFLFYLYQLIEWTPSVGAIQRLYNNNILGSKVKYPSIPEQQKIADCLSALDTQITTQTEKIEALKTHKKGLMQQIFPTLDEVRA